MKKVPGYGIHVHTYLLLIMKKKASHHRPKLLVPYVALGQLGQWEQ